jgi:hypothetical protein
LFNYGTSVFLGTYSFDNFYSDVTFGSFIKDETQLGKMVYSAGKMEFNDLNWVYSLYQMGVFVMPVLTQELNSFNYYPPMEISYLVTNPLTYEIGDVTYDGSSHVTDIS